MRGARREILAQRAFVHLPFAQRNLPGFILGAVEQLKQGISDNYRWPMNTPGDNWPMVYLQRSARSRNCGQAPSDADIAQTGAT